MRYALRRQELCDPQLCPEAPEGGRCGGCDLDVLDEMSLGWQGILLQSALEMHNYKVMGIHITLSDFTSADQLMALEVLHEEMPVAETKDGE